MQLFDRLVEAWPERTLVPSLAERWEIAPDGLRYVFHLREGICWSDGEPLTAHDVEFGIKRVLDPKSPGSSVAIYFVLENGQDYYLGLERNAAKVGVRALDDTTVEFNLAAPAPYFMSVMNRPDGGPQPRHAIETHGEQWADPELQVVSGAFRQLGRTEDALVLERRTDSPASRTGNVGRIDFVRAPLNESLQRFQRNEFELVTVRYTPLLADVVHAMETDATLGPAAWTAYLAFDHQHAVAADVELRRALAHAIDREALANAVPANLVIANGGLVPPALQGHTPDIALRFDPDLARKHLSRSTVAAREIAVAAVVDFQPLIESLAQSWREVLGLDVTVGSWTWEEATKHTRFSHAPIVVAGWLPGYPDPEYYLRLLLQSTSLTNEGGFADPAFDLLIERARQDRSDRGRLERFHEADRYAVANRVALIPLVYGRSMAFVKASVHGWWEFGKSSAPFADLLVDD
jgi:oligopeptide transport system substrate-binding protein